MQKVPGTMYVHPPEDVRKLAAKLILEEAVELVNALGFFVIEDKENEDSGALKIVKADGGVYKNSNRDLFDVIDGACDTAYVATWILCSYGVPDVPHLKEVCRANDDKFPNGKPTVREDGKFLKPPGWKGPDHTTVRKAVESTFRPDALKEEAVHLFFEKATNDLANSAEGQQAGSGSVADGGNESAGPGRAEWN